MKFFQKYELLDPLPGEGTRSFRARQIATGRGVGVHLLVGGRTPANDALLTRIRALPKSSPSKLIEVGDNEGTPYVVTAAPPFQHLTAWLADQERTAPKAPESQAGGGTRVFFMPAADAPAVETAEPAAPEPAKPSDTAGITATTEAAPLGAPPPQRQPSPAPPAAPKAAAKPAAAASGPMILPLQMPLAPVQMPQAPIVQPPIVQKPAVQPPSMSPPPVQKPLVTPSEMSKAPPTASPAPVPIKAASNRVLLYVIIAVACFVAGVMATVFILKR